ncbi:MAG: hypothetical protein ACI9HK_002925 [Pirellulaceae bacterium]|jgi:hypothetical protein
MPKYYVESGQFQLAVHAHNPSGAALWAIHRAMSFSLPFLDEPDGDSSWVAFSPRLEETITVNEQGFDRNDGEAFETLSMLAQWSQLLVALGNLERESVVLRDLTV